MGHVHYFLWVLAGVLAGFLLIGLWNSTVAKTVPALQAAA